jgi:hypothetical protein
LVKFTYYKASKSEKELLMQFLAQITGYSTSLLTRLISKHQKTGQVDWKPASKNGFNQKYTNKDIKQLVKIDEPHDRPCGQTIKVLCERAVNVFKAKIMRALLKFQWLTSTI